MAYPCLETLLPLLAAIRSTLDNHYTWRAGERIMRQVASMEVVFKSNLRSCELCC